ncbi:MAG: AMP-binding protein, partial [Phreatobacter sp.]|nr:AMP-binding protein [Phreatobacter sp.]
MMTDQRSTSRYDDVYGAWKADPAGFWAEQAKAIDWIVPPKTAFDPALGVYGRWFPDGVCNTCFNAVDRHAVSRPDQAAIIYDSPVTGAKRTISFAELKEEVATFAAVLQGLGVGKGDRVIVYMPMVPEAAIAMLACARIGAIHS